MFLESILVDVRALLMENEHYKKNYTMQNSFKINSMGGETDIFSRIASEIDEYVKNTLLPDGQTNFYEAVKFYTDKYIAHRDGNIEPTELKQMIVDYIGKLSRIKRMKFVLKVKELPNQQANNSITPLNQKDTAYH